jgi:uncharacterized protein (TIGR03118 family)
LEHLIAGVFFGDRGGQTRRGNRSEIIPKSDEEESMQVFRLHGMKAIAPTGMLLALLVSASVQASAPAASTYKLAYLTADQSGKAPNTDPNLINPWGISFSPTGPFWVSDNNSGKSTLYNSTGVPQSTIVTIPPASGTGLGTPSGTVYNSTGNFVITSGGKSGAASFLFDTEDGTISGWSFTVNPTSAVIGVNNSASGDIYKGLEIATNGTAYHLYAADFFNAAIKVFDGTFKEVSLSGTFTDPTLPSGYAPYNIRDIGGQLYVAYAKQNATKTDAAFCAGCGYIDIYDLNGNFIKRFASQGKLNAPWGLAQATKSFGSFSNLILAGNLGDGKINGFSTSGVNKGQLSSAPNKPIVVQGLWGLMFGNGGTGGTLNVLYFTAGPSGYAHGRFGSITLQ